MQLCTKAILEDLVESITLDLRKLNMVEMADILQHSGFRNLPLDELMDKTRKLQTLAQAEADLPAPAPLPVTVRLGRFLFFTPGRSGQLFLEQALAQTLLRE